MVAEKTILFDTPVLFLGFNRPDLAHIVFSEIRKIKPRKLYFAVDGPRKDAKDDMEKCQKVRDIINNVDWDCEVKMLFRKENLGCKIAVSSAIGWFFENEEEGIILEDDCLPHPTFFKFCEELLEKYRDDKRIMQIVGCNFQNGRWRGKGSYYFSKYNHVWGWASWRRAWCHYDITVQTFPDFVTQKWIRNIWPYEEMQKYWLKIFQLAYENKIDTWDYQWLYAMWTQNGLAVTPNVNLISNIGFDERATHTRCDSPASSMQTHEIQNLVHPMSIFQDVDADKFTFENHFYAHVSFYKRIASGLKRRYLIKFKIR